jgi:RHS repeat-associated protein
MDAKINVATTKRAQIGLNAKLASSFVIDPHMTGNQLVVANFGDRLFLCTLHLVLSSQEKTMSKEQQPNEDFGIRAFACIDVPDPHQEYPTNGCNGNDDDGCGECQPCPCDDAPSTVGNPGDFAGNPDAGLISKPTSSAPQPWSRLGGQYKAVGLFNGVAKAGKTFSIGDTMAFGFPAQLAWTNRSFSNGIQRPVDAGWGVSWFFNLNANTYTENGKRVVYVIPGEKYVFDIVSGGTFEATCGSTATLVETSDEFTLTNDGMVVKFDKDSGAIKSASRGGVLTDFKYEDARLVEVVTSRSENGNNVFNSLVIEYAASSGGGGGPGGPGGLSVADEDVRALTTGAPPIESIMERSYVGTSSNPSDSQYDQQSRLLFDIPESASSGRYTARSLHKVHKQNSDGSGGWTTQSTRMFIYYTSGSHSGLLKYVIHDPGYQSLANPDTASDSQLKAASSTYYQYDSDDRVSRIETCGGTQWSTVTYTDNASTPTDEANNWKRKAVYTSNDGSVKTVYCNHLGADMLLDETMGSDRWIHYFKFDSEGRQIEMYSPSSIDFSSDPYDDTQNALDVQLKTSEGRINLTSWYTTTGSGAAEGRLESRSVKNGTSGTAIKVFEREYTSRTVGGTTIYPVSKDIVYPETSGSGIETTYSYTWHSGTLAPATVTINLPNVPASQNGISHPQNDTIIREYEVRGRLTRQTDARGTVTEFEYDPATNALTKQTQDPTGLNLVTDFEVNVRGRQTRSLGPAHDIDGVSVRTANWDVRVGPYESRTAAGFQTVSSGNFTLVNPVSIRKQSDDGTEVDQITAKRGSTVESSGELSASDSFPRSSWTAWTRSIHDVFERVTETRLYHDIPSSGNGVSGTNYSATLYDYDEMGRQNRVETADGTIQRTVFNAHGQVVSIWVGTDDTGATDSDPTGSGASGNDMVVLTTNEYDNNQSGLDRQLTKTKVHQNSTAADDRVTTFSYDWRNRQTDSVAEGPSFNHISRSTFDNLDRVIKSEMLSDDGTGEVLVSRSETFFDDRGRGYQTKRHGVNQSTGALTSETITVDMEYDASGSMTKQTPAGGGNYMTYVYDAHGRRTSQTNALNQTTSMAYNDAGQAISSTDALSKTSTSEYDEIGRMLKSINPLGQTVSETEYDIAGRVSAQIDGVGNRTEFDYDDAGRRTSITDPADMVSTMTYDSMGRVTQRKNPLNQSVSFQYDYRGRQTIVTDPMLEQTETVYDRAGNVIETVDAKGESTLMAYDKLGRQTSVTDRLNKVTSFDYDRAGRRSKITDAEGSETLYGFDSFGRASSTQYPDHVSGKVPGDLDHGIVTMEYDSKGRLEKRSDQKGNSVTHNYDAAGRMTSRDYRQHGSSSVVDTDTFTFDANGRMLTAVSGRYSNTVTLVYDNAGRKSSEAIAIAGKTYTTSYTYDAASKVTSMTYPHGSVVDRSYNSRSLLDEVELDSSSVDIRTYDNAGRIATSTYGNGVVTTHTHRADGLVTSIATTNSGSQKVGTYAYGWDENRNKTSETISGAGSMSNYGFSVGASGYDDEDRLLNWDRADGNLDQSWTRSDIGNWNQKTENSINTTYTHNDAHELTAIDSTSISYDANGNALSSSSGDSLTWDLDNRLTDVGTNASFEYDALGRRVSMTEGSSTTTLVCPNAQLIAMYDSGASATSPQRIFVYGSYIDEPLMMKAGSTESYYSRNQQFSITALTDSSGVVKERYAYDAHGRTTIMAPNGSLRTSSSLDNPFAYTGRFLHNDLGLMFYRARYYDPGTGEFVSRDPLEYVNGMSLYRAYFIQSRVDPNGLKATCIGLGFDFTAAIGCGYTHGYCFDDCGNTAWVSFCRLSVGIGAGINGGVIDPGVDCLSALEDTENVPTNVDVTLGIGPLNCGVDSDGGIQGGVGPITVSPGGGSVGGDIPGLPLPSPEIGGCGISATAGANFVKVISKNIVSPDCDCDPPKPPKPPRPVISDEDKIWQNCQVICFDRAQSEAHYNACMEECLDRAWETCRDPLNDPYWGPGVTR